MIIHPLTGPFDTELEELAADKSISQRFAIFSLLAAGTSRARNYLRAEDSLNALKIISQLGAKIVWEGDSLLITPPEQITSPAGILDCGNSGTAMRLLLGLLAGREGVFVLSGDRYLNARPMGRVSGPLRGLGARILGREDAGLAPLVLAGLESGEVGRLKTFIFKSPLPSAQLKTAMILAGLRAAGLSEFSEDELSRDHSERMLLAMGAPLRVVRGEAAKSGGGGVKIYISPLAAPLRPLDLSIPNDPSSAFYFVLAALLIPGSKIKIKKLLLNPTRIAAYEVLQKMGARLKIKITAEDYESLGEVEAEFGPLRGVEVDEKISWLIDEAPALALAFAAAEGRSRLKNARELRVKESDRIAAVCEGLRAFGIGVVEFEDGFEITGCGGVWPEPGAGSGEGGRTGQGGGTPVRVKSYGDHRIAMSFAILGLVRGVQIDETACVGTSFPRFFELLAGLGVRMEAGSGD